MAKLSCRSSLLSNATDFMTVLECESALSVEFIIVKLPFIAKHGVQNESASDHLAVSLLSLENSSALKLYLCLFSEND